MTLKYMETQKAQVSAREICELFNVPFDTLSKVMQLMNNAKILHSAKGVKGGYTLNQDLQNLTYYQLYQLIEGPSFGEHCNGPKDYCSQYAKCNITHPLHRLNARVIEFFQQISVLDLIRNEL